jgi:hypothetical protein
MRWAPSLISGVAAATVLLLAGCGGGGSGGFPAAPEQTAPPPTTTPTPDPVPVPEPVPAATFQLGGAVDHPGRLDVAALSARPAIAQALSYSSGSGAQTRSYIGADLWSLLNDAGLQADPARKNDLLSRYVLATGADGYKVVFALGELNPDFGRKGSTVAYADTASGASAPLSAADGPFRVTAPGDIKGGRYVSNLVRLDVAASAATAVGSGGGISSGFAVSGAVVGAPVQFDLAALQALPQSKQAVGTDLYAGVDLWTLLNSTIGLSVPPGSKNASLAMYAVATGSDGYRATVSLGEIDPGFGNKAALVAYELNGASLGARGVARLVVPGDLKASRSVSNLVAIEVFAAPAAP